MRKKKKEEARQAELEEKQLDESTEAAVKASKGDKEKEQALRDVLHIRRTAKEVKCPGL